MSITISIIALKYRDNTGVKEFVIVGIITAWWIFCQIFELMSLTLEIKLFWANLLYLGAGLSPLMYLGLALKFSGKDQYITRKNIMMVLIIYLVFFILIFTDQYHGLMRKNFVLDTSSIPYVIKKEYGPLFPIYVVFVYSLNIISLALLLRKSIKKDYIYRKHAKALFFGLLFITVVNLFYITGFPQKLRFDLAPAVTGISVGVYFVGVFKYKLFSVMPIARDILIESLVSGMMVIDKNDRIIDVNKSILKMFQLKQSIVGEKIYTIQILEQVVIEGKKDIDKKKIVTYKKRNAAYLYEIKRYILQDYKSKIMGKLYIIDDITQQEKNMNHQIAQQKAMSIMHERERLGRELHDGLGQEIGYLNIQIQAIREYLLQEETDKALKLLEELIGQSKHIHGNIRQHILEMRGLMPRNRSFSGALKQYIDLYVKQYKIEVQLIFGENLPENFPEDNIAGELLKIIREALNNIKKHAGECTVEISFIRKDTYIEMLIMDTGVGFEVVQQKAVDQCGLNIMKERAEEIGIKFRVQSEINKGTSIILEI